MNCGGQGRWSLLGMTPMVLLLLGLHLQGSASRAASRCVDTVLGEDLQPLPPGVQRCSLPSGLLQPDVPQPGQGGGGSDGGGSRIVGGSPAVSGSYGGGSSGVGPTPQGGGSYYLGRPIIVGPLGRPIGPIIPVSSSQSGGARGPGSYGGGPPQYGAGPVGGGGPGGSAQYGGYPGQYGGGPYGQPGSGSEGGYSRLGHIKPVAKPPGIPYIPSAREWGGGRIPLPRDSPPLIPNPPYSGPYGGGAGSYNPGGQYPPNYSGESGVSGPRGRYDGSYGPVPLGGKPGSQGNKDVPVDRDSPCKPTC